MLDLLDPAVDRLAQLLNAESESVRLRAVETLLNRLKLSETFAVTTYYDEADRELNEEIERLQAEKRSKIESVQTEAGAIEWREKRDESLP